MPFSEIATISKDPVEPAPGYGNNEQLDELSDGVIEVMVRTMTNPASPLMMNEIRHAGGAISRVPADANAVGNRDAQFYLQMGGLAPTPEAKTAMQAGIREYRAALQPYVRGTGYLNFMSGSEAKDRAKDAYSPETLARLLELKAKYDPDNLFRYSYQLVVPETTEA